MKNLIYLILILTLALPLGAGAQDAGPYPEWDGYERSVLRKVADTVKIAIRGGVVAMTVSKDYA